MPPEIMPSDGEKKAKKSKLEKIYELQAANKGLKEENRTLRRQLHSMKQPGQQAPTSSGPAAPCDESVASTSNEEKLLEAMKALKRVTVKQEMSLNTLRSKAEQRRHQIALRDDKINELQQELSTLKEAEQARTLVDGDDLAGLRAKIGDLQLRCAEQENRNKILALQLSASDATVKNLQKQLDSARGLMQRGSSNRSLKSSDTAASELDVARLRKELANKIERIVLLEFDLEMCKDELHELRQQPMMGDSYLPAGETHEGYQEDYFSDDDDDEELWGS